MSRPICGINNAKLLLLILCIIFWIMAIVNGIHLCNRWLMLWTERNQRQASLVEGKTVGFDDCLY